MKNRKKENKERDKEVRRKGWEEGGRGKVEHCKKKVRDLIEAKKDAKPFDAGYT